MLAYALDWLNLLVRWLHVTAAVAWIGTSFYYIALDYHLLPPKNPADEEAGRRGRGVGDPRRRLLPRREIPGRPAPTTQPACTGSSGSLYTWLSGFALLVVLYYANASTYLVDRSVADISPAGRGGHQPRAAGRQLAHLRALSRWLEGRALWLAVALGAGDCGHRVRRGAMSSGGAPCTSTSGR